MAFAREAVEAVGDRWATIQPINALVSRLESKKVGKVSFDTRLHNHALIWQIRVFEQVALHRVVSLANGCMATWNAHDIHGAALFARDMMESTALVYDLAHQLENVIDTSNLAAARELLADRTFGAKGNAPSPHACLTRSNDVLAIISRIDREYPGTLETYNHLLEMCGPSSMGKFSMFMIIDKNTRDVTFDCFRHYGKMMFDKIVIACFLLGVFEHSLGNIQAAAKSLSTAIN